MANKDMTEDQQRDSSSPLPSYGLSKFCDILNQDTVKAVMDGINQGTLNLQSIQRVHPGTVEEEPASSDQSSLSDTASGSSDEKNDKSAVSYQFGTGKDSQGTLQVDEMENSYVQLFLGNTECIQATNNLDTINHRHLQTPETVVSEDALFGEGVAMEVTVEEGAEFLEPKVKFEEVAKYSRFRYESERSKGAKMSKSKNVDQTEDYKNLGTVKVEGFDGPAWLFIFCVDGQGRIHPYSLHGDHCEDGIYKRHLELKYDCTVKLNKVTFTTPKSKQYKDIFKKRRSTLQQLHIDTRSLKDTEMEKNDKNTVYLRAEVIFGEDYGIRKQAISTAIHNKKEGYEFKIYTIQPASAPATGNSRVNRSQKRVLIVLTEATACPKNLAVRLKSKSGTPWDHKISKKDVHVIRKAVVEFYPPPFHDPNIETAEECEVTLIDEDTKDETDPVTFCYQSVIDTEHIEEKRKRKRPRLDTTVPQAQARQMSGEASMDVLGTLDPNYKKKMRGSRQSTETKPSIPTYSEQMYGKKNLSDNEKVYSLKENNRGEEGLVARGPSRSPARPREGNGRVGMMSGRGSSPAQGSDRSELQQSQLSVSLPENKVWTQPLQFGSQNMTSLAQPATCSVVTSASGYSTDRLPVTVTVAPGEGPLSAGFQPSITTPAVYSPYVAVSSADILPTMTADYQETQIQQKQQMIFQQQEEENKQMLQQRMKQEQQIQQQQLQQQLQQQQQLQKQQQLQQQQLQKQQQLQQQAQQLEPQQLQQAKQAGASQTLDKIMSMPNDYSKYELMSTLLEKKAQEMNPGFQLPPEQMFLMLGNKITIADRSLVKIASADQNIALQLQTITNQTMDVSSHSAVAATQLHQSAKITQQGTSQQYGVPNQVTFQAQTASYPQLQNMAASTAGTSNQYQNSHLSFQPYSSGSPLPQQGTSMGRTSTGSQQLSALVLGTRNPQSSSQSGRSVFPRNNLPFSPANLDDDDVEVDSDGLKRKKPVHLYGKSNKKQANGLNRRNDKLPKQEYEVIDLTVDNKNKKNKVNTDLNDDDDLEMDYYGHKSNDVNDIRHGEIVSEEFETKGNMEKVKTINRIQGMRVSDKVRRESDLDIIGADDSGADDSDVFFMIEVGS